MAHFSSKNIQVSQPSEHVLHVQLARSPVNAFSTEFWQEYGQVFDRITKESEDTRAVVVSSSLDKIFTSGLDLISAPIFKASDPARTGLQFQSHLRKFHAALGAPERCPFPVIVAVHGPVVGLGIDLISTCDIRYTASNAVFTIKEADVGLAPDVGTLAYLQKITSNASLARELAFTARNFSASEALSLGLVSKVVEGGRDAVVKEALSLAKVIATKSPIAMLGTKTLLNHARDHSVAQNLNYTQVWCGATLQAADVTDSVRAFKEKSSTKYKPLPKL